LLGIASGFVTDQHLYFRVSTKLRNNILLVANSLLLENTPLVKFMRNNIGTRVAYFPYRLQMSSSIFGNFRKMFSNVRVSFGQVLWNLRKMVGNFSKSSQNAVIAGSLSINKKNITRQLEDMNFMSRVLAALTRDFVLATRT